MRGNKDSIINQHRQAIDGVQKHFASTSTLVLDGKPTPPKDVVATLQGAIDAIDGAATAEKAFHDAVTAQNAAIAKGRAVLRALTMLVRNQFGSVQGALGDFGIQVPARQIPSEATKVAAVAKRAATRVARHTAGKRQKAKVKGVVSAAPATATTVIKPA